MATASHKLIMVLKGHSLLQPPYLMSPRRAVARLAGPSAHVGDLEGEGGSRRFLQRSSGPRLRLASWSLRPFFILWSLPTAFGSKAPASAVGQRSCGAFTANLGVQPGEPSQAERRRPQMHLQPHRAGLVHQKFGKIKL
jgi:hypothetical protein